MYKIAKFDTNKYAIVAVKSELTAEQSQRMLDYDAVESCLNWIGDLYLGGCIDVLYIYQPSLTVATQTIKELTE